MKRLLIGATCVAAVLVSMSSMALADSPTPYTNCGSAPSSQLAKCVIDNSQRGGE